MVQASGIERIDQRLQHMLLTDRVRKGFWPPFPRQNEISSTMPLRMKIRPPSFVNLQALPQMVEGSLLADVIATIGTLDIVLGEIDR